MSRIVVCLFLAAGLRAQPGQAPWGSYGHDPQHTGLSTVGAQRLETVKWSTPVDLVLSGAAGPLYIHYGSPLVTAANTVLAPLRTSASNTYSVEALAGSSGSLLYTLPSDYTPPPHNWIPAYGPVLSQGTRLYYPGAGGTVYYRDQPDFPSGPSGQIAFYGNSVYSANAAALSSTVMISTPITADAAGNIYFGFDVTGPNPAGLTSGLARIAANGTGSWIGAAAAAQGDVTITEVSMNCAPAVSNDGSTVYFAVSQGDSTGGYLVALNSTTLMPIARVRLKDPNTGLDAELLDDSSASPTIGPDGDVYYGVFESSCCSNDDRGWLLHFNAALNQVKTPGAFGWDTTASVVPASLVASYQGTSSYLLFTKYNNYLGVGPGGNGQNKIAVLDPNGTEIDPITGATVMNEVITILGPTPGVNGGVREWCINSAAIDPFSAAAIANSEDGVVYRWDFASNSLIQQVRLTAGLGEAYTPSLIGADGAAYAINDATLFAVGQASNLTIVSTHPANFQPGEAAAQYSLSVTNSGSATTNGVVTAADILPPGVLLPTSISGSGWSCTQPAGPCTRSDPLAPGVSYPAIQLTVAVADNAPSMVTNMATVSSDGAPNSINSTASDVTFIGNLPASSLSISKTHTSNFNQGQTNATYSVVVTDAANAGPAAGKVTVTEMPPAPLTVTAMAGPGWTCSAGSCSRGDSLAPGASYPPITVTVTVANNAASPQINSVSVSGGGSAGANTTDTVVIAPVNTEVTIQTTPPGLQFSVDGGNQQPAPQTVDLTLGVHTIAVQTLQSGPSGTIYLFSGWSDSGAASHSITVGSSPATYTASFNTQYRLTISAAPAAGGSVSPSNGSFFDAGAAVPVVASPNTGYSFNGWTGPVASPVNASTTVTMSAPETVVANFVKSTGMSISNCSANTFALTVGQAATIPATITCTVTDTLSAVGINGLTISGLPNWLNAAVAATNLAAGGATTLTLTPTNLAAQNPGTLGPPTILITGTPASGGGSATASLSSVTLSVFPQLTVSPLSLIFDAPTLAAFQSQAVSVTDNPVVTEPVTATPSESVPSTGAWLNATGGNTPLAAAVIVTSTSLPPGVYSGAVTYNSGNAPNPPSVAVTLNVGQLAVSGGPVAFNFVPGITTPPTAALNVSAGPAAINWISSVAGDCAWLTDNATSGLTPRNGANPVTISYTLAGAAAAGPGTHVCTLSYLPSASYGSTAGPATTTVTLSMFPQFSINPPSLTFDLPTLAAVQSQPVSVTDTPAVLEPVTTSTNAVWLSATGGNTPLTSTVTVTPSGVTSVAGVYTAAVTYASGSAPGIPGLPVTLNVGQLSVTGGPILFNNVAGVTVPSSSTLNVSAGPAAINWISSASGDCAWLTDNATSGATPRNGSTPVTIGYTAAGASTAGPGSHVCTLSYSAAPSYGSAAPPIPVTVTLSNSSSPVFTVLPLASQSTSVPFGSTVPVCVPFQIDTIPSNGAAVSVTASPGNPAGIFSANLSNATVPSTLTVCAIPTGLGTGLSQGVFSVSSPSVLNPVTITLSLNVLPPPQCQFTVMPTAPDSLTNAVPSDGSTPVTAIGSFTVTPGAFCTAAATWTATSDSNWLVITAGAAGNGAAAVTGSFNALSDPLTGCVGSPSCSGPLPRTAFITITPTTGPPSVVQINQPGSTAPLLDRQVTALYQSILGRDPDSGGYTFWTGSGTASLSQMADDFLTSPEAFNSDMAVIAAYQAATGAPPTFAQFTAATSAIRLGMQSVGGLFSSLTGAGYNANTLYLNLLNRAPTAGESSACTDLATCFQTIIGYPATTSPVGALNNEWQSTGSFANLTSVAGDHTNSLYITMLYFVILNRDPDAGGMAYWLGIANQGGAGLLFQGSAGFPTRLQILSPAAGEGFIGSPEFQGRFQ